MFIATITHKNAVNGSGIKSTIEELNTWIEYTTNIGMWGKPAGEYPLSQLSEAELAQEISRRDVDEMGRPLFEPLIMIPAQYTIEITDITAEVEQEKLNRQAEEYLKNTDWYILRELEEGTKMPNDIKQARKDARKQIKKDK